MQARSTSYQTAGSANTGTGLKPKKGGRKREPITADFLVIMCQAVVNDCLYAGLPIRIGKTKSGGLLLALDVLTLNDDGLIVVGDISRADSHVQPTPQPEEPQPDSAEKPANRSESSDLTSNVR